MNKSDKRMALFYSRLNVNEARVLYMPFIKNFLKCLDAEKIKVDVFLAEKSNNDYEGEFSENIRIHFVESRVFWRLSRMKVFYYLLQVILFSVSLFLRKRYSLIAGGGVLGNHVAITIGKILGVKTIYMGDEFPILATTFWNEVEKKACAKADCVILPDSIRIEVTEQLIGKKLNIPCVLPNAPLLKDVIQLPQIDWHERLKLPSDRKLILFAGGSARFNQLHEVMVEIPRLPNNYVLIIIADDRAKWMYRNLLVDPRFIWLSNPLTDSELYSLIRQCLCCIGMYRTDIDLLDYVGMSSGKIMRSISCGTPVITSVSTSLDFVIRHNVGLQLNYTCFLSEAVLQIESNQEEMRRACLRAFNDELCYDVFWNQARAQILGFIQ